MSTDKDELIERWTMPYYMTFHGGNFGRFSQDEIDPLIARLKNDKSLITTEIVED